MASQLGGPVLLKQGYLQIKTAFGWKRQYYRLLQDSLFSFNSHESKTPTDEISLMGGEVKDASWTVKKANCVVIETDVGKKYYLICENSIEHQQWFDALYYGTTVSTLAEYCSPLSGGWLHFFENKKWTRRWFMIRDSFLLCYNSREDVTPMSTDGKPAHRRFVLPLVGVVVAYHKTTKNFSFSLQIMHAGELKHEFVFAAESEAIMNVWMEVLYVSTGRDLPDFTGGDEEVALDLSADLGDLTASETPNPSKSHQMFTKGTGLNKNDLKEKKKESAPEAPVDFNQFEPVDHGNSRAPPEEIPVSHAQEDTYSDEGAFSMNMPTTEDAPKADTGFSIPGMPTNFGFGGGDTQKQNSGCAQQ